MSKALTSFTFGKNIPTASNPGAVVVAGVASVTILAANENRIFATIVNDSANIVYLFFGTPAVVNQGIRLNAAGGSLVCGLGTDIPYTGIITGIATGAGSNVSVTEG